MINLDLLDIWRELYPEMRRYTWRRNTPLQQSRLDIFLISDLMSTFVTNADIKAGYRTDHSMITLTLTLGKESKNKLLWKFNNSLLKDKLFAEEINDVIKAVVEEYAALPYIPEELVAIRDKRMEGVLLRSRVRWIADGEKITKYFCGLEKRNYISTKNDKIYIE